MKTLTSLFKCQLDYIPMSHQFSTMCKSLEAWIQHDNHHVVILSCIKRPQKLQKKFNYLYHLQLHIHVQKEELNLNRVRYFKLVERCNSVTPMFVIMIIIVVKASNNNQWPIDKFITQVNTTRFKVDVITSIIAHAWALGTISCKTKKNCLP